MLEPKHLVVGQRVELGVGTGGKITSVAIDIEWDDGTRITRYPPDLVSPEDPAISVDLKLWFLCPSCKLRNFEGKLGGKATCSHCGQKVRF